MKKGLLIVSILLFLAGGVALAYAFDRFSSAAENFQRADKSLQEVQAAKDMKTAEGASDWMKLDLEQAAKAKQAGMMGAGGGVVLVVASVILFFKSRRPRTAA